MTFYERGGGYRGKDLNGRRFRWWTCGNKVLMHDDRGSRGANILEALIYGARTLLFLGPPAGVTEFSIGRLDAYSAHLIKRPHFSDGGVVQSLELRR